MPPQKHHSSSAENRRVTEEGGLGALAWLQNPSPRRCIEIALKHQLRQPLAYQLLRAAATSGLLGRYLSLPRIQLEPRCVLQLELLSLVGRSHLVTLTGR